MRRCQRPAPRLLPRTVCVLRCLSSCPFAHTSLFTGAEATLKRFWKDVNIEKRDGGYAVTLDKRPLKTPSGKPLIVPPEKRLVAALIASEWENQQTVLKPHALPMVITPSIHPLCSA